MTADNPDEYDSSVISQSCQKMHFSRQISLVNGRVVFFDKSLSDLIHQIIRAYQSLVFCILILTTPNKNSIIQFANRTKEKNTMNDIVFRFLDIASKIFCCLTVE